jgi:hypothetical protein
MGPGHPDNSKNALLLLPLRPRCAVPVGAQETPHLPEDTYKCLVRGVQAVRGGREVKDTEVLLAVLRFPKVQSDVVVSLSTPAASWAAHEEAAGIMAEALLSLRVLDWGLFGGCC